MADIISIPAKAKIKWDISSRDGLQAMMFNDNGVWFEYIKKITINRLKTLMREFSQHVPIHSVSVRQISDIGAVNCEYRCFYTNSKFTISKQPKDPDEDDLAYLDLTDAELTALLGNPSNLLADYWNELYISDYTYQMQVTWEDKDPDRQLSSKSLGKINLCRINGQSAGTLEQIDADTGLRHRFKWAITPEIKSVLKRAAWLEKGNIPAKGR